MAEGVITARNRDLKPLSEIWATMQEIRALEERRKWIRERMENITQHLTGMPRGGRGVGMDETVAMLAEIDDEHERRCREYVKLLRTAQRILNSIESENMRAFVVMKYVMDLPNEAICRDLNLRRRGYERARKCVEEAACMEEVVWRDRIVYKDR